MSNRYIPIKSLRSLQRYMGRADEFQCNAPGNMVSDLNPTGNTYDTAHGGWIPCELEDARRYVSGKELCVRAVIHPAEAESE